MKTKKYNEPTNGVLTNQMDTGTKGFIEFQAILLNKSKSQSESQKSMVELMALKYAQYSLADLIKE